MLVLIQCLYEKSQAECWVIDVRLICNSSSICSDKRVGVLSFQEDRRGREGRCGNNTAQIMIVVYWHSCWQVFQGCVTGDTFCEGYLCRSELCLKWAITFLTFFICLFPLTSATLSLSLTGAQALPSFVYHVRITCPSASRMRHVWGLKIKDETDGCKENGEGDWRVRVRIWRGKEKGLAFGRSRFRKVINPSINGCLIIYLLTSPTSVNVTFEASQGLNSKDLKTKRCKVTKSKFLKVNFGV